LKTNNGIQMVNIQKIPNFLLNNGRITIPEEITASDAGDKELVYQASIAYFFGSKSANQKNNAG
jgi:hypothetical protein